jgi:hypothetical protein
MSRGKRGPEENFHLSVEGLSSRAPVVYNWCMTNTKRRGATADGWVANASSQLSPGDVASEVAPTFEEARQSVASGLQDAPARCEAAMATGVANLDAGKALLDARIDTSIAAISGGLDSLATTVPSDIRSRAASAVSRLEGAGANSAKAARSSAAGKAAALRKSDEDDKDTKVAAATQAGTAIGARCTSYAKRVAAGIQARGNSTAAVVEQKIASNRTSLDTAKTTLHGQVKTAVSAAKSKMETDANGASQGIEANRLAMNNQLNADETAVSGNAETEVEARRAAIESVGSKAKTAVPGSVEALRAKFQGQVDLLQAEADVWAPNVDPTLVQSKLDTLSADFDAAKAALQTELDGKGAELQGQMDAEVVLLGTNIEQLVSDSKASALKTAQDFNSEGEQMLLGLEANAASATTDVMAEVNSKIEPTLGNMNNALASMAGQMHGLSGQVEGIGARAHTGLDMALKTLVGMVDRVAKGGAASAPSVSTDDAGWQTIMSQQIKLQFEAMQVDPAMVAARVRDLEAGNIYGKLRAIRELGPAQMEAVKNEFLAKTGQELSTFLDTAFDDAGEGRLGEAAAAYLSGDTTKGAVAELSEWGGPAFSHRFVNENMVSHVLSSFGPEKLAEIRAAAANDKRAANVLEAAPQLFDEAEKDAADAAGTLEGVQPDDLAAVGVNPNDLSSMSRLNTGELQALAATLGADREQMILLMKQNGVAPDTYSGFDISTDPDMPAKLAAMKAELFEYYAYVDQNGGQDGYSESGKVVEHGPGGVSPGVFDARNPFEYIPGVGAHLAAGRALSNSMGEDGRTGGRNAARKNALITGMGMGNLIPGKDDLDHKLQGHQGTFAGLAARARAGEDVSAELAEAQAAYRGTSGQLQGEFADNQYDRTDEAVLHTVKDVAKVAGDKASWVWGPGGHAAYMMAMEGLDSTGKYVEGGQEIDAVDVALSAADGGTRAMFESDPLAEFGVGPGAWKERAGNYVADALWGTARDAHEANKASEATDGKTVTMTDKQYEDYAASRRNERSLGNVALTNNAKATKNLALDAATDKIPMSGFLVHQVNQLTDPVIDNTSKDFASGDASVAQTLDHTTENAGQYWDTVTTGPGFVDNVVNPLAKAKVGQYAAQKSNQALHAIKNHGSEATRAHLPVSHLPADMVAEPDEPTKAWIHPDSGEEHRVVERRDDGTSTVVVMHDGKEVGVKNIVHDPAQAAAHARAEAEAGMSLAPDIGDESHDPTTPMSAVEPTKPLAAHDESGGTKVLPAAHEESGAEGTKQIESVDSGGGTRVDVDAVHDDKVQVDVDVGPTGSARAFVSDTAEVAKAPDAAHQPHSGPVAPQPGSVVVDADGNANGESDSHKLVFRGLGHASRRDGFEHVSRSVFKAGMSVDESDAVLQTLVNDHGRDYVAGQHVSAESGQALRYDHDGENRHMKANSPMMSTSPNADTARSYAPVVFVYDVPKSKLVTTVKGIEDTFMGSSMDKYVIGTLGPKGEVLPLVNGKPHPDTNLTTGAPD